MGSRAFLLALAIPPIPVRNRCGQTLRPVFLLFPFKSFDCLVWSKAGPVVFCGAGHQIISSAFSSEPVLETSVSPPASSQVRRSKQEIVMNTTPETPVGATGTADLATLLVRLEELERRAEGMTAAMEQSRAIRRLIMLAFLVFVVIAGWRFYSLGVSLRSEAYTTALLAELQKGVDAHQDDFSREATKLVDEAGPVVSAAFSEQTRKDMPVFMNLLDTEREVLTANLQQRMTEKLEHHHQELLRRHQKLFEEEFPSAKDPEVRDRMMANTQVALDRLIKKYYADEFEKELKALNQVWQDFPPADAPTADEPPLDSQLLGEFMELLRIVVARDRTGRD
jgi:hypothetical protein